MRGICHLPSIPIRKEPDSTSEMTSMLLFGETFSIVSGDKDWARIINDYDNQEGWISNRQFIESSEQIDSVTIVNAFPLLSGDSPLGPVNLLPGSVLPGYDEGIYLINNKKYKACLLPPSFTKDDLEVVSKKYLNSPYLWGGRSPFGIDCSGFTQLVFRICGIKLPRDSWQQAESGTAISQRKNAVCGDLAFFENSDGKITHVGMMLTPDLIIHASGYVHIDKMDDFGILNEEDQQYSHKLRHLMRVTG